MRMQTGRKKGYAAQNYSATSVTQGIFKRSVARGYFLNRQDFLTESEKQQDPLKSYGRNAGLDFTYTTLKGTWSIYAAHHFSLKPGIIKDNRNPDFAINYSVKRLGLIVNITSIGTHYYTDIGFV